MYFLATVIIGKTKTRLYLNYFSRSTTTTTINNNNNNNNNKNANNPAPVLENDTHKLLWDFDIQTNHLISARRPDLIIINKIKKICKIVDFAVPADHRIKLKECEMRDKYLDLARELKKNYGIWRWQLYQLWLVLLAR